jgi:hypothetical protein
MATKACDYGKEARVSPALRWLRNKEANGIMLIKKDLQCLAALIRLPPVS